MRAERAFAGFDPRIKLGCASAALVVVLAARQPSTPWLVAGFATGSLLLSERAALRSLVHALVGLAVVAGIPVALLAWQDGAAPALLVGGRIAGATAAGLWLLRATGLVELQSSLVWLGVPRLFVELLGLSHRYATVFLDTLRTGRDAQRLRLGYLGMRRGLRSVGALTGLVFVRAIDQTTTLSEAMALRGDRGEPSFAPLPPLKRRDAWLAAASMVALLGCAFGPSLRAVSP